MSFKKSLYGRRSTVKTKLSIFENHIEPYTFNKSVVSFPEICCEQWKDKELSLSTVKTCFSVLKEYMKYTYKIELDTKKLYHVHFGNVPKKKPKLKVWTKEQVKKALAWAEQNDQTLFKMLTVALGTGMRRGELLGLTWGDIDFLKGEITINKSREVSSGLIGPTKTNQPRVIQMNSEVDKVFSMGYTPGNEGDHCFKCFDPNTLLNKLCKATGLPEINWHDLRHTFATTCLERGMSPKWVSATLGHSKLSTTMDIYWQHFQEKVDMEKLYD